MIVALVIFILISLILGIWVVALHYELNRVKKNLKEVVNDRKFRYTLIDNLHEEIKDLKADKARLQNKFDKIISVINE